VPRVARANVKYVACLTWQTSHIYWPAVDRPVRHTCWLDPALNQMSCPLPHRNRLQLEQNT